MKLIKKLLFFALAAGFFGAVSASQTTTDARNSKGVLTALATFISSLVQASNPTSAQSSKLELEIAALIALYERIQILLADENTIAVEQAFEQLIAALSNTAAAPAPEESPSLEA